MKIGKKVDKNIVKEKLKVITKVFGSINKWKLITRGWDNFVIEIDDEWIFRFIRDKKDILRLKREIKFLKKFSKTSFIPVPTPEFIGEDFMGYKKLKGQEFSQKILEKLGTGDKKRVARQFVGFLRSLQKMSKSGIKQMRWVNNQHYLKLYEKEVRTKIFPLLSENARTSIDLFFRKYSQDKKNFIKERHVLHADLNHRNILWDNKQKEISGIIDFLEVSLGPEKRDLAIAEFFYSKNDQFLQFLLQEYGKPELFNEVKIEAKIQMFEWLIDAIEVNNKSERKRWVKKIEDVFTI